MENRALGKGLSALIPEKEPADQKVITKHIKTELISDSTVQPRIKYDDAKLDELKESIREKGILQPLLVREKDGRYEVVAGERRLKAARQMNLQEIPVIIKTLTDQEALVIALIENIQREALNPIEEAEAYKRLIEEFGYSQETIAQSVSKDRSSISNMIRLLKLPKEIKESLSNAEISFGHARALVGVEEKDAQHKLFQMIIKKGLSVREIENLISTKTQGSSRRKKAQDDKPFEIVTLEEQLQKMLGTKVRIEPHKKRGKIVIDYYSSQDLDRIIRQMIKA